SVAPLGSDAPHATATTLPSAAIDAVAFARPGIDRSKPATDALGAGAASSTPAEIQTIAGRIGGNQMTDRIETSTGVARRPRPVHMTREITNSAARFERPAACASVRHVPDLRVRSLRQPLDRVGKHPACEQVLRAGRRRFGTVCADAGGRYDRPHRTTHCESIYGNRRVRQETDDAGQGDETRVCATACVAHLACPFTLAPVMHRTDLPRQEARTADLVVVHR